MRILRLGMQMPWAIYGSDLTLKKGTWVWAVEPLTVMAREARLLKTGKVIMVGNSSYLWAGPQLNVEGPIVVMRLALSLSDMLHRDLLLPLDALTFTTETDKVHFTAALYETCVSWAAENIQELR